MNTLNLVETTENWHKRPDAMCASDLLWVERRPECAAAVGAAAPGEGVEAGAELAGDLLVGGASARHQDAMEAGQTQHGHQQHADHTHYHQTAASDGQGDVTGRRAADTADMYRCGRPVTTNDR